MKKRKNWLIVGTVVGLLILVLAGSVLAQGRGPNENPGPQGMAFQASPTNPSPQPNMCGPAGFEAAAQALGMSTEDLRIQLWGGRTLAELADTAGVDLKDVYTAVRSACEKPIREAIAKAVENGRITQEEADWLLEGLDKGYWGPNAQNHVLNRLCRASGHSTRTPFGKRHPMRPQFPHPAPGRVPPGPPPAGTP